MSVTAKQRFGASGIRTTVNEKLAGIFCVSPPGIIGGRLVEFPIEIEAKEVVPESDLLCHLQVLRIAIGSFQVVALHGVTEEGTEGTGAVLGGVGGLLAGLGLLAIPGLGPIVAAGWLASTDAGAANVFLGAGGGATSSSAPLSSSGKSATGAGAAPRAG